MDNTHQDSRSNARRAAGTTSIQVTSQGTQTGANTTRVASTAQAGTPSIQQTSQGTQTGAITTQVANTTQSGTFELFGELPAELQIKILNIAAREVPRIIERTPQGNYRGYTPALLGVSHMVREEALKVYNTLRPGSAQPLYFNPDNDTLILNVAATISTIFLIAPPLLMPITLPLLAMAPLALPPPALTPTALPGPAIFPFSFTPPTLDEFTVIQILDPRDVPHVQEWMASIGVKSLVIRLGY